MIRKARENLKNKKNINIIEMDAENMDFADNTFDTVVTSSVFCSVPDPVKGLKEIRRVCKNDGKIVMPEHVRSNKKIIENLIEAGFHKEDIDYQDIWSDIVKLIEVRNNK